MEDEGKKIDLGNFFNRIESVEKMADGVLKKTESNLSIIKEQKNLINTLSSLIETLQFDVQGMRTEIQEINNYIVIQKDEEEDRLFEEQDRQQKLEEEKRLESLKGERGEQGPQGQQGVAESPVQPAGGGGGLGGAVIGTLLAPLLLAGGLGNISKSIVSGVTGMASNIFGGIKGLFGKKDSGKVGEKDSGKGILDAINPFSKEKKDEVKEDIKSDLKKEGKSLFGGFLGFGNKDEQSKSKYQKLVDAGYKFDDKGIVGGERIITHTGPEHGQKFSKGIGGMLGIGNIGRYERGQTGTQTLMGEGSGDSLEDIINRGNLEVPKKRGLLSLMGGAIDSATGNLTDFDQKGGETFGGTRILGGLIDSATGNLTDIDKKGGETFGLTRGITGVADFLTGNKYNFDKKPVDKTRREIKNEKRGVKGVLGGFVDALTGNLTDIDARGGKPLGLTRNITGALDFATANAFDLDQRGGILDGLFTKKKKKKGDFDKDGNYIGDNTTMKLNQQKRNDLKGKASKIPMETNVNPDGSITSEGSGTLIGGELFTPGQPLTEDQKMRIQLGLSMGNTYSEEIMKSYNMEAIKSEESIKPVIESDDKDLSKNIYQEIDNSNEAISQLVTQNIAQNGNANDQNTSIQVPANEPQVSDAEIKNAKPNIPFISLLTNKTRKEMSLTSEGSSEIAGYID